MGTAQRGQGREVQLSVAPGRRPGFGQAVAHAAVRSPGEAIQGERGPQAIATQALQSFAVVLGHGAGGVEGEAVDLGAAVAGVGLGGRGRPQHVEARR